MVVGASCSISEVVVIMKNKERYLVASAEARMNFLCRVHLRVDS
jgi:hypothetical protein